MKYGKFIGDHHIHLTKDEGKYLKRKIAEALRQSDSSYGFTISVEDGLICPRYNPDGTEKTRGHKVIKDTTYLRVKLRKPITYKRYQDRGQFFSLTQFTVSVSRAIGYSSRDMKDVGAAPDMFNFHANLHSDGKVLPKRCRHTREHVMTGHSFFYDTELAVLGAEIGKVIADSTTQYGRGYNSREKIL